MISKIADSIAACNINIAEMTNKSRDEIAINLIDLECEASKQLIEQLKSVEHVMSVRSINIAAKSLKRNFQQSFYQKAQFDPSFPFLNFICPIRIRQKRSSNCN